MELTKLAGRLGLALVLTLFAVTLARAAPQALVNLKLSGEMPSFAGILLLEFYVSPDGRHVVYTADQEMNNKTELFVTIETFYPRAFVQFVTRR